MWCLIQSIIFGILIMVVATIVIGYPSYKLIDFLASISWPKAPRWWLNGWTWIYNGLLFLAAAIACCMILGLLGVAFYNIGLPVCQAIYHHK